MTMVGQIEHGSNVFELIEFKLDRVLKDGTRVTGRYGVNVAKVREVVRMPKIDPLGASTDGLAGIFELRGVPIPAVNLREVLGERDAPIPPDGQVIVAEFSMKRAGFIVNETTRIRRIEWNKVVPPSEGGGSNMTGMILLDNEEFLYILDLEKVVGDLEKGNQIPGAETLAKPARKIGSGETLLVVEDSPVISTNVQKLLSEGGFNVLAASNGQEALDLLNEKKGMGGVQIVVSDVEMPQMDGLTLIKKMKEDEQLAHIPVIIHSSLSGDATVDGGKQIGAFEYVVKNDFTSLFSALEQALGVKAA